MRASKKIQTVIRVMIDIVCQYPGLRGTYVYYCRTYEKAVSGEEGKERTCAKDTTSRGVRVRVRHLTLLSGAGEGRL